MTETDEYPTKFEIQVHKDLSPSVYRPELFNYGFSVGNSRRVGTISSSRQGPGELRACQWTTHRKSLLLIWSTMLSYTKINEQNIQASKSFKEILRLRKWRELGDAMLPIFCHAGGPGQVILHFSFFSSGLMLPQRWLIMKTSSQQLLGIILWELMCVQWFKDEEKRGTMLYYFKCFINQPIT